MDWLWQALQDSGIGVLARRSTLLYPAANILHVLGVMGFFALVAAMDLAVLGALPGTAARRVQSAFRPFALLLLGLIAATGFVLFAPDAVALSANPALRVKLLLILLALANAALHGRTLRRNEAPAPLARLTAGLSLLLWLSAAALGRLIAYV